MTNILLGLFPNLYFHPIIANTIGLLAAALIVIALGALLDLAIRDIKK